MVPLGSTEHFKIQHLCQTALCKIHVFLAMNWTVKKENNSPSSFSVIGILILQAYGTIIRREEGAKEGRRDCRMGRRDSVTGKRDYRMGRRDCRWGGGSSMGRRDNSMRRGSTKCRGKPLLLTIHTMTSHNYNTITQPTETVSTPTANFCSAQHLSAVPC